MAAGPQGEQPLGAAPFPPFRADPNAAPKENLVSFLNYVVESHVRLHRHAETQGQYLRTVYEMLWNAGYRPGVRQPDQPSPPTRPALDIGGIVDGARVIAQNADAFKSMFSALFRGR